MVTSYTLTYYDSFHVTLQNRANKCMVFNSSKFSQHSGEGKEKCTVSSSLSVVRGQDSLVEMDTTSPSRSYTPLPGLMEFI